MNVYQHLSIKNTYLCSYIDPRTEPFVALFVYLMLELDLCVSGWYMDRDAIPVYKQMSDSMIARHEVVLCTFNPFCPSLEKNCEVLLERIELK